MGKSLSSWLLRAEASLRATVAVLCFTFLGSLGDTVCDSVSNLCSYEVKVKRVYVYGEITEALTMEQEEKRRRSEEAKGLNTKVNLLPL